MKNISRRVILSLLMSISIGITPTITQSINPKVALGGLAVVSTVAASSWLYYYRLHYFVGLDGIEKRLHPSQFRTRDYLFFKLKPNFKNVPKAPFKWYRWHQNEWQSGLDIVNNKSSVMQSLVNELDQYLLSGHDNPVVVDNPIEIKDGWLPYRSTQEVMEYISFDTKAYLLVQQALKCEEQELRDYMWACNWYIRSIDMMQLIGNTTPTANRTISYLDDLAQLSSSELDRLRMATIAQASGDNPEEMRAIGLFFDSLFNYLRVHEIRKVVTEYVAAKYSGHSFPPQKEVGTPGVREQRRENLIQIDHILQTIDAARPSVKHLDELQQLVSKRMSMISVLTRNYLDRAYDLIGSLKSAVERGEGYNIELDLNSVYQMVHAS